MAGSSVWSPRNVEETTCVKFNEKLPTSVDRMLIVNSVVLGAGTRGDLGELQISVNFSSTISWCLTDRCGPSVLPSLQVGQVGFCFWSPFVLIRARWSGIYENHTAYRGPARLSFSPLAAWRTFVPARGLVSMKVLYGFWVMDYFDWLLLLQWGLNLALKWVLGAGDMMMGWYILLCLWLIYPRLLAGGLYSLHTFFLFFFTLQRYLFWLYMLSDKYF